MNLCVDQGNTLLKAALFDGEMLISHFTMDSDSESGLSQILDRFKVDKAILSSVSAVPVDAILSARVKKFVLFNHQTPVPVVNLYETPETLGKDRLAAVVGASWLKQETDLLVIDAGTAITFDFIDSHGVYHGGNIAPGLEMRAESLHHYTGRLPRVELAEDVVFLGKNTSEAIIAGIIYGAAFEIDGYIDRLLLKYPKLCTFLTGGSSFYFDGKLKNPIFADKNLVLTGLNRILQYNVS